MLRKKGFHNNSVSDEKTCKGRTAFIQVYMGKECSQVPYLGQFSAELTIASTASNKNSNNCFRLTTVSAPFSSLAGFNCKNEI